MEQDTYNLKKECEEKDAAIKELSVFIRSKDAATSKVRRLAITILLLVHQVKVQTGLIVLIPFSTENRGTRRSYSQKEHNYNKVEKGSHCSGTEGKASIVYMLHNVSSNSKHNHPCKTIWP